MTQPSSTQSSSQTKSSGTISGAEVVLISLMVIVGMGIWVWTEREFNEIFHNREPNEERLLAERGVLQQQYELAQLQNDRSELQKQLIAAQLEELIQSSTKKTLVNLHPGVAAVVAKRVDSAEALKAYQEATAKQLVSATVVASLTQRLDVLKAVIAVNSRKIEKDKQAVSAEFHRARASFLLFKPAVVFAASALIVMLLLVIVQWAVSAATGNRVFRTSTMPFLAIGALFILFAYQAFEVAGAAIVSLVLLVILLRKIGWTGKQAIGAVQQ